MNKDLSPNDIALKIRTEPDERNKTHHFFAVFLGGHDLMWISTYVYITESDKIGSNYLKLNRK